MAELREPDFLAAWRRPPGTLEHWVRWAVVAAAAATIATPWLGARVMWDQGGASTEIPKFWFCNGVGLLALLCVVASFVPMWRLSRFVQLAVLLPIAHLALVAVLWTLWLYIAPRMATIARWDGLVILTPLGPVIAAEAAVAGAAAWVVARRRRDAGWSHAFVMIALVHLLLLGLWLPIASFISCHGSKHREIDPDLAMTHPIRVFAVALGPPLVVAIAHAALAIRRPEVMRRVRPHAIGVLAALLGAAIVLRVDAVPAARVIYANFIPVMLAALVVACAGIAGVGAAMWLRSRTARRRFAADRPRRDGAGDVLEGTILADDRDEPVACIEIASWLRGPRLLVRPFVLATSSGDVPVDGARLVAAIDRGTTALRIGEALGVLRAGEAVSIVGHDRGERGDPFRTQATAIAGDDVVLAPRMLPRFTFADVALALWRPAIAYLVILVAVAAPALAALAYTP
jgi:hypothetical protein